MIDGQVRVCCTEMLAGGQPVCHHHGIFCQRPMLDADLVPHADHGTAHEAVEALDAVDVDAQTRLFVGPKMFTRRGRCRR